MKEFAIQKNEAGQRFDKYLKKLLRNAGSGFLYKMLRKKNIVLNGKRADGTEKLSEGDIVKLFLSDETFAKFSGGEAAKSEYQAFSDIKVRELPVIYEDADVIIINKPSGMLSQKAKPEDISANEYLIAYLIKKGELHAETLSTFRPSVCNRLDRNTSGLLIAGKTLRGLQEMSEALKSRSVQKYYRCIVKGEILEASCLKGYLLKDAHTNKAAIYQESFQKDCLPVETEYRPAAGNGDYTELEVHLITGRSHQIRAHLASIGHPIVGDAKYGGTDVLSKSLLLHAYKIVFEDGKEVTAPFPKAYEKARSRLLKGGNT